MLDDDIYGLTWSVYNENDDTLVSTREFRLFNPTEDELKNITNEFNLIKNLYPLNLYKYSFRVLSKSCTTYERGLNDITFHHWFPISIELFEQTLLTGKCKP